MREPLPALPGEGEGRLLVRNQQSQNRIDCRTSAVTQHGHHAEPGAAGRTTSFVPSTAGTYDLTGQLARRAAFRRQPVPEPRRHAATELAGPCFSSRSGRNVAADLARLGTAKHFRLFRLHVRSRRPAHECNFNRKTFIEVYLSITVAPLIRALAASVSCDDLTWELRRLEYSVQTVGVHKETGRSRAARSYRKWLRRSAQVPATARRPTSGAIWMVYYPAIAIEWYPHVLVVSWLIPRRCPERRRRYRRVLVTPMWNRAVRARVHRGGDAPRIWKPHARATKSASGWMPARRALMSPRGIAGRDGHQSPMESGMQHSTIFLRHQARRNLSAAGASRVDQERLLREPVFFCLDLVHPLLESAALPFFRRQVGRSIRKAVEAAHPPHHAHFRRQSRRTARRRARQRARLRLPLRSRRAGGG